MTPHLSIEPTFHASNELVWAVRGEPPARVNTEEEKGARQNACGALLQAHAVPDWPSPVLASSTWISGPAGAREDQRVVNCPKCLVLLRNASDPVRWDYLLERNRLGSFVKVT